MHFVQIIKSELHQTPYLDRFHCECLGKNRTKVHNINRSNIRQIKSKKNHNNKNDESFGKVFQEDFFELDPAALQNVIFIWQAARSNS